VFGSARAACGPGMAQPRPRTGARAPRSMPAPPLRPSGPPTVSASRTSGRQAGSPSQLRGLRSGGSGKSAESLPGHAPRLESGAVADRVGQAGSGGVSDRQGLAITNVTVEQARGDQQLGPCRPTSPSGLDGWRRDRLHIGSDVTDPAL
jgi:hypothetical protein